MTLKTEIQKRIIAAIKNGSFLRIDYADGIPTPSSTEMTPHVVCNEVSGSINQQAGMGLDIILTEWVFRAEISFDKEVDFTEFLLTANLNLTFSYDPFAVTIAVGSSYVPEHPCREGSHTGTKVTLDFYVNLRK